MSTWKHVELSPMIEWVKDNVDLSDIIDAYGEDTVLSEIGEFACVRHFGNDLLEEYPKDTIKDYFDLVEKE